MITVESAIEHNKENDRIVYDYYLPVPVSYARDTYIAPGKYPQFYENSTAHFVTMYFAGQVGINTPIVINVPWRDLPQPLEVSYRIVFDKGTNYGILELN